MKRETEAPGDKATTEADVWPLDAAGTAAKPRFWIVRFLVTLTVVIAAGVLGSVMWRAYMESPWTRDGTVRAYVVTTAPEVAGRVVELPIADNQLVRKGDLLVAIDPTDYKIAVSLAEAAVTRTETDAQNASLESQRRQKLTDLAVTQEQKQTFATRAVAARAQYQQALANRDQARVNLERTRVVSPVDGWVTNLIVRLGDYARVGESIVSVVDADSFWVDGYFLETNIGKIREGDPASVKLMGYSEIIRGHVGSIARGINVPNAQPNKQGLATVNPIFTWVRLAQRIPVRIEIDRVPEGLVLVAGMTATVQIDPPPRVDRAPHDPRANARSSPPSPGSWQKE